MLLLALPAAASPGPLRGSPVDPAEVFGPFLAAGQARSPRAGVPLFDAGPLFDAVPLFDAEPVRMAGSGARFLDVYQAGNLAILQDADGEWLAEAFSNGGDPNWILNSVQEAFYGSFADDYQYLTILLVRDFGFFGAFYSPLANDVSGIGYDAIFAAEVFDRSATQLDGFIFMNYAGYWQENPDLGRYVFGQEFGHRWGSFVNIEKEGLDASALLGRDSAHWSYYLDSPNSPLEGNAWVDTGDGTWTTDNGATSTYSDLDLYLMGIVGPDEVGPQTLLVVEDADAAAAGVEPATTPAYLARFGDGQNVTLDATTVSFSIDDIVLAEGERVPSVVDSPKGFRMAFAVLVLSEDVFGAPELAGVDALRARFEADWEADVGDRADLDTTLGGAAVGEDPVPAWGAVEDTGDTAATVDCCKPEVDEPVACGCASGASVRGAMLLALGLAGLGAARRRSAP